MIIYDASVYGWGDIIRVSAGSESYAFAGRAASVRCTICGAQIFSCRWTG